MDFNQPAAIPIDDESHGGEDVAIYANGPMSHLFHGVHEQHYMAHVVRYAACLGDMKTHCEDYINPCGDVTGGAMATFTGGVAVITMLMNILATFL